MAFLDYEGLTYFKNKLDRIFATKLDRDQITSIIDDTAGEGVTDKTWSANKNTTELDLKASKNNPVFTGSISLGRKSNTTIGDRSTAIGVNVEANASNSHAEGYGSLASGAQGHAEGYNTIAGNNAHSEGTHTEATGPSSHAEGWSTKALTESAHAEGYGTIAAGARSHAAGAYNVADSYNSWPEWTANTNYVIGDKVKRTVSDTVSGYVCRVANNDSTFDGVKWAYQYGVMNYVEIIGNGTGSNSRSNARVLDWNGNERILGDLYVKCNSDSTGGKKVATVDDLSPDVATIAEVQEIITEYGVSA